MHKGYKIELKPNNKQLTLFEMSSGTARFAYNWMLCKIKEKYEQWKALGNPDIPKPKIGSAIDWHKEFVLLKKEEGFGWIYNVSKCCGQEALRDLEIAFKKFLKGLGGYPNAKKKGMDDHFRLDGSVFIDKTHVQLPNIGKVRLKEKDVFNTKTKLSQITVSRQSNRWFASFFIDDGLAMPSKPEIDSITENDVMGIDLGCKDLAITSDGEVFANPKAYRKSMKKLKREQRRMSRRYESSKKINKRDKNNKLVMSNGYKKSKLKVAKAHKQISDLRKNTIHKFTSSVVKAKPSTIVIETLRPKNMSKNHRLAKSIMDSAFGEVVRQLTYKCEWNGIHLVKANEYYASSQYCSRCGSRNPLVKDLKIREWACPACQAKHQRDVNAALNLRFYGLWTINNTLSSRGIHACGDERSQFLRERCSSVKQEANVEAA